MKQLSSRGKTPGVPDSQLCTLSPPDDTLSVPSELCYSIRQTLKQQVKKKKKRKRKSRICFLT